MSILSFLALALVRGEVEVTSNVNPIQIYGVLSSQTLSGRGGTGLGRRRGQDWLEPWMIDNLSWALVAETAKRWLSLRLSGSTQVLRKTSGGKALLYVSHQDSLQNFPEKTTELNKASNPSTLLEPYLHAKRAFLASSPSCVLLNTSSRRLKNTFTVARTFIHTDPLQRPSRDWYLEVWHFPGAERSTSWTMARCLLSCRQST